MKKKLWILVLALGLLMLAGCGQKYVKSDDNESKYDYGWVVNKDNTVTLRVKGKWDKDCVWRAEYDESILNCEPGKKKGSFVVSSNRPVRSDFFLRLYRQEQEDWEYTLQFTLQGDGTGGVFVKSSTHQEPVKEGSYTILELDEMVIFAINTSHLWKAQVIGEDIRVDRIGNTDEMEQFALTAVNTAVKGVEVEFCDEESPLVLTAVVDIDVNGVISITDVQTGEESKYVEKTLELFWEEFGFKPPISDKVAVEAVGIITNEVYDIYGVGALQVGIGGVNYDLYLSMLPRVVELSIPQAAIDPETQEWIPVNVTYAEIGSDIVTFYQKKNNVTAIWQHYGCNYVLEGYRTDVTTMQNAVAELMGV